MNCWKKSSYLCNFRGFSPSYRWNNTQDEHNETNQTIPLPYRDGNILDMNADSRDLNALENLLKMMNGTKN